MQFHENGFVGSRDPLLPNPDAPKPDYQTSLPDSVDVLIVGAGPAGQLLATQLSRFADITTRIIETKPGRLEQGQADGLQCRTIEIFEAFGIAEQVLKEAYWVNETTFWTPGGEDGKGIVRSGTIRDTEEGLSEFPHVILNQARLHDLWLERMGKSASRLEPSYSRRMAGLEIPRDVDEKVEVKVEKLDPKTGEPTGEVEVVKAKFVVGCDGARSAVRKSLGYEMEGDFANQAWGVMDALVVTDFPDIRVKTTIHAAEGSIIIIPREGGYMVRLYIGLDKMSKDERASTKNMTSDLLIEKAQKVFHPYKLDVREVAYWSVYEVGQRLTHHFDDCPPSSTATTNGTTPTKHPRVFIAGDACHTHSAKAGQGMNVSMNDAYNLGWKLVAALHGTCQPSVLLPTYSSERQPLAQLLIDFDRKIAALSAAKPRKQSDSNGTSDSKEDDGAIDPSVFQEYFTRQGRFMAGVETCYASSAITSPINTHQHLAKGFQIGTRFHSAQVLRFADVKPIHLGHTITGDGRFRVFIFGSSAEDPTSRTSHLWQTCAALQTEVLDCFTPGGWDVDSVIDVRCVLPQKRQEVKGGFMALHPLLVPQKGKLGLQDYEKVYTDEESYGFGGGKFFAERGVDTAKGVVVVVRPDQYVAGVWPLGEQGSKGIQEYFGGFMVDRKGATKLKINGP